ncbi:ABC transporter ATP-binding protein [Oceanivirga salmonicida]|uniref:ABC transporter ATP-binding protein n=1 Tax=Oceanivirga salmonicida TaxID=1769291 RepID=UPI0008296522|nr:ABC transporter ATP-binding protein [Oceanivirga salmonicida]
MSEYILEMKNVRKEFFGGKIVANDDINLQIKKGEIHAIVGENGAGKSTLMKILNGLYDMTSGEIFYKGKKVNISTPTIAAKLGIGMVYQHFMLVEPLTVAENMVLGFEPKKAGVLFDKAKAKEDVIKVSKRYGLNINPDSKVEDLSVGIQQRIEILKILFKGAELLIFDEPSAVLTPQEVKELYVIMRNLIKEGKTIIFITHKLQEVLDLSDNITVIRRGKDVGRIKTSEATKETIANMMVGRQVLFNIKKEEAEIKDVLVKVKDLHAKNDLDIEKVKGVSFDIREGEILGIAGVEGNGQTELIEVLAGLRKATSGEYMLGENVLLNKSPKYIRNSGLSHIPENRHKRATINEFSIKDDLILGVLEPYTNKGFLDNSKINKVSKEMIEKYDIRPKDPNVIFGGLSGGNQQKVVVARELEKENKFIIAAQPTRGVDIGAIEMIHNTILHERTKGKAILVVSAELSEIMALSDRIAVMYSGKIVDILNKEDATIEKLGILMAGGKIEGGNNNE